jgi:hypothetical protein
MKTALIIAMSAVVLFVLGTAYQKKNVKTIQKVPLHLCNDTTHATCDGSCSCDGVSCEAYDNFYRLEIDYSKKDPVITLIDVSDNTTRVVGDLSNDSLLIKEIIKDNE